MLRRFVCAMVLAAGSFGIAQRIVEPQDRARFNALFDQLGGDPLKCETHVAPPALDFSLRFELRYIVECDLRQFGGQAGTLTALMRIRPSEGAEVLLGDRLMFPAAPKPMTDVELRRTHYKLGLHGALAAGQGVYDLEFLVVDNQQRVYRHHWTAKAAPRGRENRLSLSMAAHTVSVLNEPAVTVKAAREAKRQITVIVNAAPLNPGSLKLRRWDRAFLLEALASLLRQVPYSSLRVVAFNLEQQREIFRKENFEQTDVPELSAALRALDLGKISYGKLERNRGWAEFLLSLLREETAAERPSDAIVFLGPKLRLEERAPADLVAAYKLGEMPRVFCVAYYPRVGADFPDSLQELTLALKGKVFRIHSPSELAQNLEKLEREIKE